MDTEDGSVSYISDWKRIKPRKRKVIVIKNVENEMVNPSPYIIVYALTLKMKVLKKLNYAIVDTYLCGSDHIPIIISFPFMRHMPTHKPHLRIKYRLLMKLKLQTNCVPLKRLSK